MIPKEDRCEYCNELATTTKWVVVDSEPSDEGMQAVYGYINLCQQHALEYDNREGMFDHYKYGGDY